MKKNLYDIMNEAEASEISALLENTECEIPKDISIKNIKEKTLKKCGFKKKALRSHIMRYGALAACVAIMAAAIPTAIHFGNTITTDRRYPETGGENGIYQEITPSIAYPTSVSYTYHFPLEDGSVLCKEVFFELEEGKLKESWRELLAPFFEHCKLGVSVTDWKLSTTGEKTEISEDGKTVTHTPGSKTLTLYFEGTAKMDDHTLKCLVNTIDSISYVEYIKLVYNGEPVSIDGECPEEGFTNFKN
jgi:hypothetical protein